MNSPIRVLHVVPWLVSGGVERRRLLLAARLPKDIEQRVVCAHGDSAMMAAYAATGVPVDVIGGTWAPNDLASIRSVARIAREHRADIIHGAVYEGVTMASLGGRLGGIRNIVIEEIDLPLHRSARGHQLFRALAANATHTVAVSEPVRDHLHEVGRVPHHKISVITNGIGVPTLPDAATRAADRAALGIPDDAFVVGSVGRVFNDHKRFSDLIDALALVDRPNVRVLIAGDGPDLEMLQQRARAAGVADRVVFAGYRPDVGRMYAQMDVFALVSERESFGLVYAEAMSVGLPVIATTVGGPGRIVVHGETGLHVPRFDPPAIAEAIRALEADRGLRERLGAAGKARAAGLYSPERYVGDVERLYRRLGGG